MSSSAEAIPPRWELYRLLGEPIRLKLLALAAEEELAIGELAELLGESQPNVSRHVAPLRRAGLVSVRKQGTRVLVHLAEEVRGDPVVDDALESGRALCTEDGSLARIADVLRRRELPTREYFARVPDDHLESAAGAHLAALALLLPRRRLAIDVGTGDGALLDVLAPVFDRVVGIDREASQLDRAKLRIGERGYRNVDLWLAELDAPEVLRQVAAEGGADAVFAARVLHHAPKPAAVVRSLARLLAPGGALVVIDYESHADEVFGERQADLWLGFTPDELRRFAADAGLEGAVVRPIPSSLRGRGSDAHLPWQALLARLPEDQARRAARRSTQRR